MALQLKTLVGLMNNLTAEFNLSNVWAIREYYRLLTNVIFDSVTRTGCCINSRRSKQEQPLTFAFGLNKWFLDQYRFKIQVCVCRRRLQKFTAVIASQVMGLVLRMNSLKGLANSIERMLLTLSVFFLKIFNSYLAINTLPNNHCKFQTKAASMVQILG